MSKEVRVLRNEGGRNLMLLYGSTIFLSAFLLFQVQPIISKYILPWYGGSMSVWTTCMLFFQMFLLFGYLYAHLLTKYFSKNIQAFVHLVLMVASLLLLPVIPSESWKPQPNADPTLGILSLLTVNLGLPYFILSATSPLLQRWFTLLNPGVQPYRLFALSNAGSLLALLSFPFLIEPLFSRIEQAMIWAFGLGLFTVLCGTIGFRLRKTSEQSITEKELSEKKEVKSPTQLIRWLWILLPATSSIILLAITNKLCREVVVVPFLWVLPLMVYLLTFIISFDRPTWYSRRWFGLLFAVSLALTCYFLLVKEETLTIVMTIFPLLMFSSCMICHGELARLKPGSNHLTLYYLLIAFGGALGSLFVVLVAPLIFDEYNEFYLGFILCSLLWFTILYVDKQSPLRGGKRKLLWAFLFAGTVGLVFSFYKIHGSTRTYVIEQSRNFYGVISISEYAKETPVYTYRTMSHDGVLHGQQFMSPKVQRMPMSYYSEKSGLGVCFLAIGKPQFRVGAVGMGVGTIAVWMRPNDYLRLYEINPEVERLAQKYFTYMKDCMGKMDILLGDARLSLEREQPQNFDILALDAFNSDSPPLHLLTKEAFDVYLKHLAPDGAIIIHGTSSYLDFYPAVTKLAALYGMHCSYLLDMNEERAKNRSASVWLMVTKNQSLINHPDVVRMTIPVTPDTTFELWTDDYSSLFPIMTW
ncbi:MAG: fused MFS/spermidine synthase [Ignavibacteriae bacterium]|nr:fused MFS/spermidine synthase [Ignavibacteriota bacterium]